MVARRWGTIVYGNAPTSSGINAFRQTYRAIEKGWLSKMAAEYNSQLIGQIPLVMEVGEAADHGKSIFSQGNKTVIESFEKIAVKLISATIF